MNTPKDPELSFTAKIMEWSVHNRLLVVIGMFVILTAGILAIKKIPLDAIPDLSDTQVIIRTDFPGQSPQIVEDLITYPLSTTMLGLPKTKNIRGYSMFGASFVYIIFEDHTDQYWARNRVNEALLKIQGSLPKGSVSQMGPDATGVGWIYQYALIDKTGKYDLAYLRSLQDWFLKFELASIDGVAEIASVGGFVKEYQILIDPNRLRIYDIPLHRILEAVKASSQEVGGRVIEQGEMEFMIRSYGYITDLESLKKIVVFAKNGTPVLLSDFARIIEGPELRRGVVELNGEGETVSGIIIMRTGKNALNVIKNIKEKLKKIQKGLPEGVEIIPVYDRSPLIMEAVSYLKHKLFEEGIVVALICLIFLLHIRSAFIAIITLPLGILAAFVIMEWQGISANIMSLGGIAIAIGAMVDASIVMIENAHRNLSEMPKQASKKEKELVLLRSAKEVGPGLFFSLLIITVSFLPIFALTGQSFRLFAPLAYTKTYAMAAASLLSITFIPVLMLWLIRGKIRREEENPINRLFTALYQPILKLALKIKWVVLLISLLFGLSVIFPFKNTGSEFMPDLYEGELLYMPTMLPSVSIMKSKEVLAQTNRLIKTIPEVDRVFAKAGRADTATDPAPVSMIETWIKLKPRQEWRKGLTIKDLIRELNQRVQLPGLTNSFGYPIKTRIDMNSTGIHTPVGIKISGTTLTEIRRIAVQIQNLIKEVKGTRSVFASRVMSGRYLEIIPNRDALARLNIDLAVFQRIIQTAIGGMKITESIQGRERYNIMLRYERKFREYPDDLADILIPTPQGQHIPLGELASIRFMEGPPMIKSENARLTGWVFVDIENRDIGSFITEAQKLINHNVDLPEGYVLNWSGQFEQMLEAKARMKIAIPAVVLIIFILLMLHFQRLDRTLIVMISLPFGLIGGIWALYFAGYHFSVAVGVGFIALGGIAVETAIIMLIYLDQQIRKNTPKNLKELHQSIMQGAVLRIRPILMTVLVIILGLMPIFITEGAGSDVMRRIALPMIGGMISTSLLTLIIIPVIYYIWEGRQFKKH